MVAKIAESTLGRHFYFYLLSQLLLVLTMLLFFYVLASCLQEQGICCTGEAG